ncbi:MAG TPA: hypothetical protein PK733_01625 [Clostridiales bacterium]|nr:hypothetical protein [Clostridiales bacterium]
MKKIMFFDDFIVNRTDNTRRVFKEPVWDFSNAFNEPGSLRGILGESVIPAPDGGYFLYYLTVPKDKKFIDENLMVCTAYSEDGISFLNYNHLHPRYPDMPYALGHTYEYIGIYGYFDKYEKTPDYRYKAVCATYGESPKGLIEEAPVMLVSSDALHWKKPNDVKVIPSYVDCYTSLLYNPVTGNYQTTSRRRWGERRICLVESRDLKSWSMPRAIIHPLPSDEPTTHLYGMPHFYYEPGDIFIGMLWKQIMPYNRIMDGPVLTEYAYSYDGLTWNRTHAPVMKQRNRGELGGGSSYVFSMMELGDELIFHANACKTEHGGPSNFVSTDGEAAKQVVTGRMKKDRFVCIDSGKGAAEMTTQNLKIRSSELTLNLSAPFGRVKAQVLNNNGVVEGFAYDDCDPIQGDHLAIQLRWRGKNFEEICKRDEWIKLQIAFEQAEIYSITGDFVFTINTRAPIYDRL